MEKLKHKLHEALILHDQEDLSSQNILKGDQQMLNVINDHRLNQIEAYEELNAWFIREVIAKINIKTEEKPFMDKSCNQIDQQIYQQIAGMPLIIQADLWRLNSGRKKQLRARFVINTKASNDYYFAALIELLHLATLIQDDVIDHATLRRHEITLNQKYDNRTAILISDLLLVSIVKAIKVEVQNRIKRKIDAGELSKYFEFKTKDLFDSLLASEFAVNKINSIDDYEKYAIDKTAKLFAYSMILGAISSCKEAIDITELDSIYNNGIQIGLLFQKVDDYIDYSADINQSGKDSRDIENNIKNYMYFQLQTSSREEIKIDLIKKLEMYIEQMPEYTDELTIIRRSIQ